MEKKELRTVILGTDWWTDCDDVAAVRIACRAAKQGLWHLSGIVLNGCMPESAASLRAFLIHEGFPDLPLGLDHAATDFGGMPPYQKPLATLPHPPCRNEDMPDGGETYLRLLRDAPGTVELIEIGYPQVLAALCADAEGLRLLREKVSHLWMMAGNWEKDGVGMENNIARNARSRQAAVYLFAHCPCPITFLGWEVGADVLCGKPDDVGDENDPLRLAFRAHGSVNGRSAWDPMLVLLALTGDAETAGYTLRRGYASADAVSGENRFVYDDAGRHAYVVRARERAWYEEALAAWLCASFRDE